MANTVLQGEVTEQQVGRIDLMVRTLVPLSRSKLDRLFVNDCVTLNDTVCRDSSTRVAIGDKVVVTFDPQQGYAAKKRPWSDRAFAIIHEDAHLIVVNKSASVLSVATSKEEPNTLLERVSFYLARKKKNNQAYLIHRLDRGMSGAIVFGKTPDAAKHLKSQFDGNTAVRTLITVVAGTVKPDSGTLESYLDTHSNLSRYSTDDKVRGQHAITKFKVLKRMHDTTALELELETARRHQARVQLFDLGHPVLGETRYGIEQATHEKWKRARLAMHASSLTFKHPKDNAEVTYSCPLPEPMKKLMRQRPKV
jgi:23S rRNA pseudouridine1911/1915/1917 synthase